MTEVSKELNEAICRIFEKPEVGFSALGISNVKDVNFLDKQKTLTLNLSTNEKISLLRRKLEDWVELKGLEIQEFDDLDNVIRIQYEALSTLIFLRDLNQYFPEIATASRSSYKKHINKL